MLRQFLKRSGGFVVLWLLAAVARADWINLTGAEISPNIAEITVLDDRVRLVLEAYIGDLETFEALVPDDWIAKPAADRAPADERLQRFALETFQVLDDTGKPLPAQLTLVEPRLRKDRQSPFAGMLNPYTRQRLPEAPDDKRVLYAEIDYLFGDRQPRQLTFVPPLDESDRPRVSMGFITYHKSVPVIDFRYLGAPATLELDWQDPWYSRFTNPNLKRHHESAMISFLYVEPYEVRHELLVRVKDLANWMELGLRDDAFIEIDELEPLKQRIGDFLLTRNRVRVDGEALPPVLDRSSYVTVSLTGIQLLEQPQRLEVSTAIVGVIIAYITKALPQQVTVDWDLFTDQASKVPATATDPAGPFQTYLTAEDPVHTWTNYLKQYQPPTVTRLAVRDTLGETSLPLGTLIAVLVLIPLLVVLARGLRKGRRVSIQVTTIALVTAAAVFLYPYARINLPVSGLTAADMDETAARELLQTLLQNVYRSFDFRAESDVYDKLSISVSGDLLTDLYLQNRRAFAVQKAGGAQARVDEVEIQQARAESLGGGAYRIRGHWTAAGSVGHWGHTHRRANRYDANITIEPDAGHWKITGLEILDESRIDSQPARAEAAESPE